MARTNDNRRRARVASSALLATLALTTATSAHAGPLVQSATACESQQLSRPFAPWLDYASYTPVAGGSFEDGAPGWTLAGGAAIGTGNESFYVGERSDTKSLRLPPGSSAVSAPICAGLLHPTARLFARSSANILSLSTLRVDVRFRDAAGTPRSLYVGSVLPSSKWQPSLPLPVVVNLLTLLPSENTQVSFVFTPAGSATWQIDDVYLDPMRRS